MDPRALRAVAFAVLLFVLVQAGALALVDPFTAAGYRVVENPSDPTNSLVYLLAVLVATGLMLAAFRYDFERAVRAVVILASVSLSWYVFSVVVPSAVPARGAVALACSLGIGAALVVHPEWYVIDAAGVLMGAGAAGLFGISFGPLPAITLLLALAVYDAISVYGTEHMLSLAEGVMDLRVPVVLVVPLSLSYSLLEDDFSGASDVFEDADGTEGGQESAADGGTSDADGGSRGIDDPSGGTEGTDDTAEDGGIERDAFFVGLGDAVMPTVMVASAAAFSSAAPLGVGVLPALNLPALGAAGGTLLGLGLLLAAVMRGRAHAGLPLLNGGAIGGYLLGSALAGVPLIRAVGLAPYI
ncbi:MAG: presenilin family intramembrane aspartyl protease PSH [Haloferacaceae archaeon]